MKPVPALSLVSPRILTVLGVDCPAVVPPDDADAGLLRDLARAYADATEDDPTPTIWTPAHVQIRLVAAFDVLRRSAMTIGVMPAGGPQVEVRPLPGSTGLPVPPAAGAGDAARFPGVYQKRSR